MAAAHGARTRYTQGCRCDDCKSAHNAYRRNYRQRRELGLTRPAFVVATPPLEPAERGPVECAAAVEVGELVLAEERPGLVQVALALARIMDNPRVVSTQPAAARQLVAILDMLSRRSHRRAKLAVVRSMTEGA